MNPIFRFLLGLIVIAGMAFATVFLGVIVLGVLAALAIAGVFLRWRLMRAVEKEMVEIKVRARAQRGPEAIEGEYHVIEQSASAPADVTDSRQY